MTPEEITCIVCNVLGVSVDDVQQKTHKDRADRVVIARFASISLCRSKTTLTLNAIAEFFGLKNHATVINSVDACSNMVDTNRTFAGLFEMATRLVDSSDFERLQQIEFYPFIYSVDTYE